MFHAPVLSCDADQGACMFTDYPIVGQLRAQSPNSPVVEKISKISPFEKGERYPDFKPISPDTVLHPPKELKQEREKRVQKQKRRRGRFFTRTIP